MPQGPRPTTSRTRQHTSRPGRRAPRASRPPTRSASGPWPTRCASRSSTCSTTRAGHGHALLRGHGESVASCSFHLRMLAKYRFVEPAERVGREALEARGHRTHEPLRPRAARVAAGHGRARADRRRPGGDPGQALDRRRDPSAS
ncbi:hypothetical protein NKG05_02180 [Oerskovia sp. M15]